MPDLMFPISDSVPANGGGTPPLTLAETLPEAETVPYFTDVRFPGQVSTFESEVPLIVRLTIDLPKEFARGRAVGRGI